MNNIKQKFIGWNFIAYLGMSYIGVNLYLNEKLRAEMEKVISSGKKKEKMLNIHENLAGSYEKKTENFEFRNHYLKYRRIMLSYAHGRVLECGVGTGRSLEFYKPEDVKELIGIDYSNKMINQAYEKLDNRDHFRIPLSLNILLKRMDCETIEENFPQSTFDTVVDFNNFHSYNDYKKVYDGIKHVLKDNGIFIFLARGESDYLLMRDFYKLWKPYIFMKYGQDLTHNWSNLIENDKDWEILYKQRKNCGKTYIYILKLHKINPSVHL